MITNQNPGGSFGEYHAKEAIMSKRARLTEKHMQAIDRVRNKGYSWRDVQKYMKNFYKLKHNATTYMRHYRKWKVRHLTEDWNKSLPKKKSSLWERIKSFFGA